MEQKIEWVTVFKDKNVLLVENYKNVLESKEINAIIINKTDSNYPMIGIAELKVPSNFAEEALQIIADA